VKWSTGLSLGQIGEKPNGVKAGEQAGRVALAGVHVVVDEERLGHRRLDPEDGEAHLGHEKLEQAVFQLEELARSVGRLAEGAAAVAGGDLSVDLPVTGRDEVGYLTEVFNGMVAQLRAGREQLAEANAVLRDQNAELEQLSMTDALTELFNRRYLMKEFDKEVSRAGRHERTLGVLMIDVDRFKQYNDTYGHLAGDTVLSGMGRVIKDAVREPDIPARYGGEEFIVLLPDCNLQGAIDAAERIRTRLAEEVFEGRKITVSIGAAEFPTHGESPKAVIGSADAALYEAKDSGRDRVVAAGPSSAADRKASAREKPVRRGKAARRKKTVPKKKAAPEGKP